MLALLRFADVPAIYVCHDWCRQNDFAPRFPRILRFDAIDDTCCDRLICEDGIENSSYSLGAWPVEVGSDGVLPLYQHRQAGDSAYGGDALAAEKKGENNLTEGMRWDKRPLPLWLTRRRLPQSFEQRVCALR